MCVISCAFFNNGETHARTRNGRTQINTVGLITVSISKRVSPLPETDARSNIRDYACKHLLPFPSLFFILASPDETVGIKNLAIQAIEIAV